METTNQTWRKKTHTTELGLDHEQYGKAGFGPNNKPWKKMENDGRSVNKLDVTDMNTSDSRDMMGILSNRGLGVSGHGATRVADSE